MSGSITLHKDLGVNPRLTFCQRCGGESQELVLLGSRNYKDVCNACGMVGYGGFDHRECPKCHSGSYTRTELEPNEKLPSPDLCEQCKKEVAEHTAIVRAGGVFFRCAKCHASGVIKATANMAKLVRQKHQEQDPSLPAGWFTTADLVVNGEHVYRECGIEFDDCEQHTPE